MESLLTKGNETMTDYKGIDYGMGITNRDFNTNIRYGVIHMNECCSAWCESSEIDYPCESCDAYDSENEECTEGCCEAEGLSFINDEEYVAWQDSQGDIFIERSPYFTYAAFCSPCAPGACYLMSPLDEPDNNNKCYCFGHDMFWDQRNGVAPYPVYSVKTGKLIPPTKE